MASQLTSIPVVLFTFNRPELTEVILRRVIEANPSRIYFVQDGPRETAESDWELVRQVRNLVQLIPAWIEVIPIFSDRNLGLPARFLTALDDVFSREERAVIIEDDCLVELSFFQFASRCLELYQSNEEVFIVSAHRPVSLPGSSRVVFDEVTRVWGWATWADRWKAFRESPPIDLEDLDVRKKLLSTVRSRTSRLMARNLFNRETLSHSWAVGLTAYSLQAGLLGVSPPKNAVENMGASSGTHPQDWAFIELPRSRPIRDRTKLSIALPRPNSMVWFEDLIRGCRWTLATLRRPRKAVAKIQSLLS